jgi:hypothetical protein
MVVLPALLVPLGLVLLLLALERIEAAVLGRHPALDEEPVPGTQDASAPTAPTRRGQPTTGHGAAPVDGRPVVVRPRAAGALTSHRAGRAGPVRCTTDRRVRGSVDRHDPAEPVVATAALTRPGRDRLRAPR